MIRRIRGGRRGTEAVVRAAVVGVAAAVVGLGSLVGAPAIAGVAAGPYPGPRAHDEQAVAALERAAAAPASVAYSGTQVVATWSADDTSATFLVQLDHRPGHGTSVQVGGTAAVPRGAAYTTAAAETATGGAAPDIALLSRNYTIRAGGTDRVVGRRATVVEVVPPGPGVSARLWLDEATGLLLRQETYDAKGHLVSASAFLDLRTGALELAGGLPPLLPRPADREPLDAAELAAWRERGWTCPEELPAGLRLQQARVLEGDDGPILHLTYSDGLLSVSLFEQRGSLDAGGIADYREQRSGEATVHVSDGFPRRVVWQGEGTVYTVLSDAPGDTVDAVVAALPHDPPLGPVDRLRQGLERVASWFNPLG